MVCLWYIPAKGVLGKLSRRNVILVGRGELRNSLLLCSLRRPTTHCTKRPHPPSPTSPTGALNDKESSSDHYQAVPELWTSLPSCLQGTISLGRDEGLGVGWVRRTSVSGRVGLCACVTCECAVYGGVCNLILVVCPR